MQNMRLYSIRGATCTENSSEKITESIKNLMTLIVKKNNLQAQDIVNIQYTVTSDLTALNPATALRKSDIGIDVSHVPLFCSQEPEIEGMLKKVIRVMITVYMKEGSSPVNIYTGGAEVLRPDIVKENSI